MNRYIIGEVGSGKTKEMLRVAKDLDAVVVCKNPEAMRVKAHNYGLFRMDFVGYNDLDKVEVGRKVVVDELKNLFAHHGYILAGFNMTVGSGEE